MSQQVQKVSEFRKAIEDVCNGSEEAVWEFIETYGPHIQRVVRRRLHQSMRAKFDSLDFVQMVWASFFTHPKQIAKFNEPEELIRYLVTLARNKVVEESRRRLKFEKHNVTRERSLHHPEVTDSSLGRRQDTPSQIAIARETWRDMMERQPELNRRIVQMRITGASYVEIGETLGIREWTARQVIEELAEAPLG